MEFNHDYDYIKQKYENAINNGKIKGSKGSHKALWYYFHDKKGLEKISELGGILRKKRTIANYHSTPFYFQDSNYMIPAIEEIFFKKSSKQNLFRSR